MNEKTIKRSRFSLRRIFSRKVRNPSFDCTISSALSYDDGDESCLSSLAIKVEDEDNTSLTPMGNADDLHEPDDSETRTPSEKETVGQSVADDDSVSQQARLERAYDRWRRGECARVAIYEQEFGLFERRPKSSPRTSSDIAIKARMEALEAQKQLFGENHPDVLFALNHVAQVYYRQGQHEEARRVFLETQRMSLCGGNH